MPKVYGVTGYAQNGKNSIAEAIRAHYEPGEVDIFGFADALRDIAKVLGQFVQLSNSNLNYAESLDAYGYEATKKDPTARKFLQVLGTEAIRDNLGEDVWIRALDAKIQRTDAKVVVVADCRFENEVDYIKENGELWAVRRMNFESGVSTTHPSEAYIRMAMGRADTVFDNEGSIEQLFSAVSDWLDFQVKSKRDD